MRGLNDTPCVKRFLQSVADIAKLPTVNVRVCFRPNEMPHCVAAIIVLPTFLRDDQEPRLLAHTWLHELRHANDYLTDLVSTLTREEAELRAQRAEHLVNNDLIDTLWTLAWR